MPLKPLGLEQTQELRRAAKRAGRQRHQEGSVKPVGKNPKKWRGFYYIYVTDESGKERRVHKSAELGLKSEVTKTDAKEKLRAIIAEAMRPKTPAEVVPIDKYCTLNEFWLNVALPMWEPRWKGSSRKELKGNIQRYVLAALGNFPLREITKAQLQIHVNGLAEKYSKSVVEKALVWSRALLEEALENDYIAKNPAKSLEMPQTRKERRPVFQLEQLKAVGGLPARERLILRLLLVLGLRPGEVLALRPNDVDGMSLRIDEANRYGKITDPKTEASATRVWMTPDIRAEIVNWIGSNRINRDNLLFPAPRGGAARLDNYRTRFWNKAMEGAGLKGVTLQMCRRSCGTYMQKHGAPKDIQAHLRHAQISTTMDVYVQAIPESVRSAVEGLDRALFGEGELHESD